MISFIMDYNDLSFLSWSAASIHWIEKRLYGLYTNLDIYNTQHPTTTTRPVVISLLDFYIQSFGEPGKMPNPSSIVVVFNGNRKKYLYVQRPAVRHSRGVYYYFSGGS